MITVNSKDIVSFLHKNNPTLSEDELRRIVNKHIEYETITHISDFDGIAGVVRFNVIGETAHVLELFLRPGVDGITAIKKLALKSWKKFPWLRFFRFEREMKYFGRPIRVYKLTTLFKIKSQEVLEPMKKEI